MLQKYQPGQEVFYWEEGSVSKVRIVENNSDREMEAYKIEFLEIIKDSPRFPRVFYSGLEIEVSKVWDLPTGILWEMNENQYLLEQRLK